MQMPKGDSYVPYAHSIYKKNFKGACCIQEMAEKQQAVYMCK